MGSHEFYPRQAFPELFTEVLRAPPGWLPIGEVNGQMTVSVPYGAPTGCAVADCARLSELRKYAQRHYARLAKAPDSEIADYARGVRAALAERGSPRAAFGAMLRRAIGASNPQIVQRAARAMTTGAGLFEALAVRLDDPWLIAADKAAAVEAEARLIGVQIVLADDISEQQDAALIFVADEWAAFFTLVSGPGAEFSRKLQGLAQSLSDAMLAIAADPVNEAELRHKLTLSLRAVDDIETTGAGLPTVAAEWRQFMLNGLDAEIFAIDLLMAEYKRTGCRIDCGEVQISV